MMTDVRILCGANGSVLAEEICGILGVPANCVRSYADWTAMKAGKATLPDPCYHGDSRIEIPENVRGRDVYVIQSTCSTAAEKSKNVVELMLILSALRRSAARRVCAVIPYFAYCRQTQKLRGREPISAADVSILLQEVSVDNVVTVDIFREQTAGFFAPSCCFDNLSYMPVCARYFWKQGLRNPVVVAPHASTMPKAVEVYKVRARAAASLAAARTELCCARELCCSRRVCTRGLGLRRCHRRARRRSASCTTRRRWRRTS
eukprot:4577597-Prymnesium_polylepis.2